MAWGDVAFLVGVTALSGMAGLALLEARDEPARPRRWPQAKSISSSAEAEGYALLAAERSSGCVLLGEALILMAGAMLGAFVSVMATRSWALQLLALPIVIGIVGTVIRSRASTLYGPMIGYYRERALHLSGRAEDGTSVRTGSLRRRSLHRRRSVT